MYNCQYFTNLLNMSNFTKEDTSLCLISHDPLEYNYITLNCGHSFNYESIYNEMIYQQTNKILDNRNIKINQIKCPYCRTITNNNLPYFKYYNLKKIMSLNNYNRYSILHNHNSRIDISTNTLLAYRCNYMVKSKMCNEIACVENNDINICRCNKHNLYTIDDYAIINNINNNEDYLKLKKYTVKNLKTILKNNNISCSGNKEKLIIKIIINNFKID